MRSRWHIHKDEALTLRKQGVSMTTIGRRFGIPRSTLSGWFKSVVLTETQRTQLMKNSRDGWMKARSNAVDSHHQAKLLRIKEAEAQAQATLQQIDFSNPALLDLAFAMLYWGEGTKKRTTSLGSSDPKILRFMLLVLQRNYGVTHQVLRCELHLRMDQDGQELIKHWSIELGLPIECFKHVAYDKRTEGRPTYRHYKGVCLINCGNIAIQRKLISLYNLFCDRVSEINKGT